MGKTVADAVLASVRPVGEGCAALLPGFENP